MAAVKAEPGESSQVVRDRVIAARQRQANRIQTTATNSELTPEQLRQHCQLEPDAQQIAQEALSRLNLSARGYTRTLKVARTIADLEGTDNIAASHLTEALQYRIRA